MKKKMLFVLSCSIVFSLAGCDIPFLLKEKANPKNPPKHPEQLVQEPVQNLQQYASMDGIRFPKETLFGNTEIFTSKYYGMEINKKHPQFGNLVDKEFKATIYEYGYKGEGNQNIVFYAIPSKLSDKVTGYSKLKLSNDLKGFYKESDGKQEVILFDKISTYVIIGENTSKDFKKADFEKMINTMKSTVQPKTTE